MPTLSFNQKVWAGFIVIVVLLTISGLSSLWNLFSIDGSNARVNEVAVPVVREANQVQIELLKLANLSALGFNALTADEIKPYREKFEKGTENFARLYEALEGTTASAPAMTEIVANVDENYTAYIGGVREMFDAKEAVLVAKEKADADVEEIIELVGRLSDAMANIMWYESDDHMDDMELISGALNQAETLFLNVIKQAEELQRTTDQARLETAHDDFLFIMEEGRRWLDQAFVSFKEFGPEEMINNSNEKYDAILAGVTKEEGLAKYKAEQLKAAELARNKLLESKDSVNNAVEGLDNLLASADDQFSRLQTELNSTLDFGIKSAGIIMVVLLALATQNFNSMRMAIRKKMDDLAQLNQIGGTLAAARDQSTALDAVLHSMSEKVGIDRGSVYLFNKENQLEAKAFMPPMVVHKADPITFEMGKGILGKAAETKKSIFVADTSRDKGYIAKEGETPRALLCVPLVDKDVLIGAMNFSGDVKNVAFADSDYEFVSSVAVSLVTTIKNIRMVEVIEEHNRNLEKKVEQRTAALKQKNDDIANMLSNMHQGLFTIVEGGQIHPEYAAYLETIFETKSIANRNFTELLFENSRLSTDIIDSGTTAVASIVGEDSMMYDFNSHLLVKEITLQFPNMDDKLIELDWDPIIDEDDVVSKLMVTVRDVTELKALEAEAEGQKQELMIIGEILAIDGDKFSEFVEGSEEFVDKCRSLIEQTKDKNPDTLAELFRNMHTVKGNARTYGFKHITETVHEVENTYDRLRKEEELGWDPQSLLGELQQAEEAIKRYSGIFSEKLGRIAGESAGPSLDPERVHALMEKISGLVNTALPENVVSIVKDTYETLAAIEAKPLGDVISDVVDSVQTLAAELGKGKPKVQIDSGDVLIRSHAHNTLVNTFMHVMRNAVDHGIEMPEERAEKGKPEDGSIKITASQTDRLISFAIQDDGRGIALSKVFDKAKQLGIYDQDAPRPADQDIANLIFSSGFSTADEVSEISGRGVGMDAVKDFLNKAGGGIEVVLDEGTENADFRSFTTYIHLPRDLCLSLPEFAIAS
ncbi:MAG: GAF domain-containing protein [Pseudomonadales bacterium]|nr:GAF domain-containing protein [Pseudomonadales bacterium]